MMTKNWYAIDIKELKKTKAKLINWVFDFPNNPKRKKVWLAIDEVISVIELKREAKKDPFIKELIKSFCL